MNARMFRIPMTALAFGALAMAGCDESGDAAPCEGSGVICTFMGDGTAALGTDGVDQLDVSLYLPQDIAEGPDSQLYVLDWNNHRVRTIDPDGTVRTVIGTGELGDAPDGPALQASLNHPTHVSFDPLGDLILSAWHNSKVMRMDLASGAMEAICGNGQRSYGGDDGPAIDAILDLPVATAFDSQGRMFIMDQANQRVRRVDTDGIIHTVVGPNGEFVPEGFVEVCDADMACKVCKTDEAEDPACDGHHPRPQGFEGDGGPGTSARIFLPVGQSAPPSGRMAMGADDTLYIADTGNHRIRALTSDGIIDTVAGSGPDEFDAELAGGYSGDGGDATAAVLNFPKDVAVDAEGNIYIADWGNSCVRVVDPSGTIDTFAGICGQRGFDGDGGAPDEALLDRPYGVAVDRNGNVYIADTHNHRVRVVYR